MSLLSVYQATDSDEAFIFIKLFNLQNNFAK